MMPTPVWALPITDADVTIEPSRMTVQETYAMILDDLLDAKSKINASNPEGRLNKNGVNLLLSRVYLYMGQWQNIDAANAVSTQVAARANVVGVWGRYQWRRDWSSDSNDAQP